MLLPPWSYATLLSISKMAGPLSAAATAHWVPLAFRSHSNNQQTDLASMADHVRCTTQLVNFFFFIKLVIFRRGSSFCYLSKCFIESASALVPPLHALSPHTHALSFSGELLYMSALHCEIEEGKLYSHLSRLIICISPERALIGTVGKTRFDLGVTEGTGRRPAEWGQLWLLFSNDSPIANLIQAKPRESYVISSLNSSLVRGAGLVLLNYPFIYRLCLIS